MAFSMSLFGEEIISEFEYGQMLYNNPRGVSCMPCHGVKGEGKEIIRYFDKGQEKILLAPNIIDKSFQEYKKAIKKGPKVMPKYFLTDEELKAIYSYIQKANSIQIDKTEGEVNEQNISDINNSFNIDIDGEDSKFDETVDSSSL
jgi:cytochrome c553